MPPAQREIRSEFEMRQEADGYQVTLEMPGLRSEDLDVSIADGMLRFKGETKTDMRHVTIDRAARLPSMADTESDKVKVYHADGLITVFLPNLPEPERRVPERRELNIELLPQPPSVMLPEDEATGSKGTGTEDDANGYTFTFAVPGLNTDDLTIAFEGGSLSVSGETKGSDGHVKTVDRQVQLAAEADVDSEQVLVSHEDEVLKIFIPRRQQVVHGKLRREKNR